MLIRQPDREQVGERTFAVDDREPVRGDVVPPEFVHGLDVGHRRDRIVLAGCKGLQRSRSFGVLNGMLG